MANVTDDYQCEKCGRKTHLKWTGIGRVFHCSDCYDGDIEEQIRDEKDYSFYCCWECVREYDLQYLDGEEEFVCSDCYEQKCNKCPVCGLEFTNDSLGYQNICENCYYKGKG